MVKRFAAIVDGEEEHAIGEHVTALIAFRRDGVLGSHVIKIGIEHFGYRAVPILERKLELFE